MRQRDPPTGSAGDGEPRGHRHVGVVGGSCEGPFAADQEDQLAGALDPDLSGQWQNQPLKLPSGDATRLTGCESHDVEAGVLPARLPRPDSNIETVPARRTCLAKPRIHDAPPCTNSAATSTVAVASLPGSCCWLISWSTSWSVGMAVEHSSRDATIAPACLLYTSPSPRDRTRSRMPS